MIAFNSSRLEEEFLVLPQIANIFIIRFTLNIQLWIYRIIFRRHILRLLNRHLSKAIHKVHVAPTGQMGKYLWRCYRHFAPMGQGCKLNNSDDIFLLFHRGNIREMDAITNAGSNLSLPHRGKALISSWIQPSITENACEKTHWNMGFATLLYYYARWFLISKSTIIWQIPAHKFTFNVCVPWNTDAHRLTKHGKKHYINTSQVLYKTVDIKC